MSASANGQKGRRRVGLVDTHFYACVCAHALPVDIDMILVLGY